MGPGRFEKVLFGYKTTSSAGLSRRRGEGGTPRFLSFQVSHTSFLPAPHHLPSIAEPLGRDLAHPGRGKFFTDHRSPLSSRGPGTEILPPRVAPILGQNSDHSSPLLSPRPRHGNRRRTPGPRWLHLAGRALPGEFSPCNRCLAGPPSNNREGVLTSLFKPFRNLISF